MKRVSGERDPGGKKMQKSQGGNECGDSEAVWLECRRGGKGGCRERKGRQAWDHLGYLKARLEEAAF